VLLGYGKNIKLQNFCLPRSRVKSYFSFFWKQLVLLGIRERRSCVSGQLWEEDIH